MGVPDVPQWLPSAFVRSARAAGATAPSEQVAATCHRLLDRWREPDRHFHNLKHLIDVLARVDELAEETHHPDLVRLAAWYHGAIFDATAARAYSRSGGEDEVASAELARAELGALGVPQPALDRVAELITALRRPQTAPGDIDALALRDACLAMLAAEPQKYQAYRKAVRAEYSDIPPRHYLEARLAIVRKLLARRHLFVSPLGGQWEDAARENLTAELDRLTAELAALGECAPEESVTAAEAARGQVFDDAAAAAAPAPERPCHVFTAAPAAGPVRAGADAPAPPAAARADAGQPSASADGARPASPGAPRTEPAPAAGGREPASTPGGDAPVGASRPGGATAAGARPSSLEALPPDLQPTPGEQPRPDGPPDRADVVPGVRGRAAAAVREARARAQAERERLARARAERDAARGRAGAAGAGRDGVERDGSPERRDPTDGDGREDRPGVVPPRSGIERDPDTFDRPPATARRRRTHR
ncbi:hypothetical protein [Georgenia sp. TF02-10]|uniref:HD domain-containing protein n=1 Tax=Georgenia sp. TF02-10 TaxID=2917725 RepID=UPI00352CFDA1